MPSKRSKHCSLSDLHYEFLERMRQELHCSFAECLRFILDDFFDRYPNPMIRAKERELDGLSRDAGRAQEDLKLLKMRETDEPFMSVVLSGWSKARESGSLKRAQEDPPEIADRKALENCLHDLPKDTPTGRIARKRIGEILGRRPGWLQDLPEEYRQLLKEES